MSDAAASFAEEAWTQIAALKASLAAVEKERDEQHARVIELEKERDVLRASHEELRLELELFKHRLFVGKAERIDTKQLELEFREKLREVEEAAKTIGLPIADDNSDDDDSDGAKKKGTSKGRRKLLALNLPDKRIELTDPVMEKLVADGKALRHDFEESCRLMHQRGGLCRVITARAKYRHLDDVPEPEIYTTPLPPQMFPRSIALPSLIAHVITFKICDGTPLFRIEDRFAREGLKIDRGTMSRWLEHAGATFGCTVVEAMRKHALETAFCIATDATGVAIQPLRLESRQRQFCRKGHFLVQIADRDHVFFNYLERETGDAIKELFDGFSGYVQADAKSVFNQLFEPPEEDDPDGDFRKELGCFSHLRTKFWNAASAKSVLAREGLRRISRIFELESSWSKQPHAQIKQLRDVHLRPHVNALFDWTDAEYAKIRGQRGLLATAFGYAHRQRVPLSRFLEDGRLLPENNRSERALRQIASGRKRWLFFGSDDHASSAAHLFTMITSARLHQLDPEEYLRDLIYVLPFWPRDRYLELAPKFWRETRSRLDPDQLESEFRPLDIPSPLL